MRMVATHWNKEMKRKQHQKEAAQEQLFVQIELDY